jgi:hypothetical protein
MPSHQHRNGQNTQSSKNHHATGRIIDVRKHVAQQDGKWETQPENQVIPCYGKRAGHFLKLDPSAPSLRNLILHGMTKLMELARSIILP